VTPKPETPAATRFSNTEAAELCAKGVERFCPKPYNEAEAVDACNKGDERACRTILEKRAPEEAEDASEVEPSPSSESKEEPPKRRVFKPVPSVSPGR
jgi:hypothetical protein